MNGKASEMSRNAFDLLVEAMNNVTVHFSPLWRLHRNESTLIFLNPPSSTSLKVTPARLHVDAPDMKKIAGSVLPWSGCCCMILDIATRKFTLESGGVYVFIA